jgi:hypothetical protein
MLQACSTKEDDSGWILVDDTTFLAISSQEKHDENPNYNPRDTTLQLGSTHDKHSSGRDLDCSTAVHTSI